MGVIRVESVYSAFPVAGATGFSQLLKNNAPVLITPLFGMFRNPSRPGIILTFSLLAKLLFHLGLCGDSCMISSREPEGGVALLTGPASQNVLNGIVKHMAHGQYPGDIGWGNDDRVRGFIRICLSAKGPQFSHDS